MRYSEARLEHVLNVFRDFKPYATKRDAVLSSSRQSILGKRKRYALREASSGRSVAAGWTSSRISPNTHNSDGDDDYDPGAEGKKKGHSSRKQRNVKKPEHADPPDQDYARDTVKPRLVAELKIVSEKGRQRLRSLAFIYGRDGQDVQIIEKVEEESTPQRGVLKRPTWEDNFLDGIADKIWDSGRRLRNGKVTTHAVPVQRRYSEAVNSHSEGDQDSDSPAAQHKSKSSESSHRVPASFSSRERNDHDKCNGCSSPSGSKISSYTEGPVHPPRPVTSQTTITTCFSHPVNLRHILQSSSSFVTDKCHFCNDWRFGILGYGRREVNIIADPTYPYRYQEIAGGHRAEGKETTRMCISCALDRLAIVRCHGSQNPSSQSADFNKITNAVTTHAEQQKWLAEMFNSPFVAQHPHIPNAPFPTCSICPAPALYRCCKWQRTNKVGRACEVPDYTSFNNPTTSDPTPAYSFAISRRDGAVKPPTTLEAPINGCGLQLCLSCYKVVKLRCRGVLIKEIIEAHISMNKIGGRADWEFLIQGDVLDVAYNRHQTGITSGIFGNSH